MTQTLSRIDRSTLKWIFPALTVGLLTAALIVSKTGRDALFFHGKGVLQLPLATLLVAAASLPLAILFVKAMKIWGARAARVGVLLFGAAVIGTCAPFLKEDGSFLLFFIFMFIPSIFAIMFASMWLLASDLYENESKQDSARAFGKIGACSLFGGMLGGFLAKWLSPYIEPKWLIFVGAMLIFVALLVTLWIHRKFKNQVVNAPNQAEQAVSVSPLSNKYARGLIFISMSAAFAGLLIDTQFYLSASMSDSKNKAGFFANFYIYLNFSSLIFQVFLAHRIQDKVGLRGGLMILPFMLVGAGGFATLTVTSLSRTILKVTEGGIKSSIYRSVWEQAFIPIQKNERSFVKLAVDGVAARVAECAGAIMLFIWVRQVAPNGVIEGPIETQWIAWLNLAVVILWLVATWRLETQMKRDPAAQSVRTATKLTEDARFPDQCPCVTELGKDIR